MAHFQILNGPTNRVFSTKMVHFQILNGPPNRVFSTKIAHFQILNGPQNRAKTDHFPERQSHLSENWPFSNIKWAPKSRIFDEKYRFSNMQWTARKVRTSFQNRPSGIWKSSFYWPPFEKKVVKTLKANGVRTHQGRTQDRTKRIFYSPPDLKPPRFARGKIRSETTSRVVVYWTNFRLLLASSF